MTLRKKIFIALAVLVAVTLLVLALLPAPIPVSVVAAERGYFAEYVEDEGWAQLRDTYKVSAPISGFLHRVTLEPGDEVVAGDAVFALEAPPSPGLDSRTRRELQQAVEAAAARLKQAEAELVARRAERDVAEREYRRFEELHRQGSVSTDMLERSGGQRDVSRAAVDVAAHAQEAARHELESLRAVLATGDGERALEQGATLQVRAPIAGTIINRMRCCEGPINAGEPVLEIGDLDRLEVQIDLLSMDAVRVRPGMRVILQRWGGGDDLEGEVRRVEPRGFQRISALGVEEQRVPVLVEIRSPREQWRDLGHQYRVEGRFVLWEGQDEMQIPTSALFRKDDRWLLFTVRNGRARVAAVDIGRRSGLRTQVMSGLEAGDLVITHPSDRLRDGSRVAVELR